MKQYSTVKNGRWITAQQILSIRAEYKPYRVTAKKLADKYKVSPSTIYAVVYGVVE